MAGVAKKRINTYHVPLLQDYTPSSYHVVKYIVMYKVVILYVCVDVLCHLIFVNKACKLFKKAHIEMKIAS